MPPVTPSRTRTGCPRRRAGSGLLRRRFRLGGRTVVPADLVLLDLAHRDPRRLAAGRFDARPGAAHHLLGAAGGEEDVTELAVDLLGNLHAGTRSCRLWYRYLVPRVLEVLHDFLHSAVPTLAAVALGDDDRRQGSTRPDGVIVDNNIPVPIVTLDFPARCVQPAAHLRRPVEAAQRQPPLEVAEARRQDEDTAGLRVAGQHLIGALDVDVEEHVEPPAQPRQDFLLGGAVAVAVHLRPL